MSTGETGIFWFVCDGKVEAYSGQEADWRSSIVVFARSPEDALLKVMKFHLGRLKRSRVAFGGKDIEVIC